MGKSRFAIALVVGLLSLAAPLGLALAAALAPVRSTTDLALLAAACGAWLAVLVLANWWEFTGLWLRWAAVSLLAAGLLARWILQAPPGAPAWPGATGWAAGLLLAPALWLLAGALRARRHPGEALALEFPLRGGRFLVTDGGDGAVSFLLNYHYGFGGHRGRGVAGSMRFAMDVVELGPWAVEAPAFLPRRNQAFRIWERTLHAPCDGIVARAVDEVEDNAAFGDHRPYGLGNHVVLRAGSDHLVVLGHLRRGSIRVQAGQAVRVGDELGRVGNSGWTERPHLHMQASRSPDGDPWRGTAVPMRFGGRFLVKNQVVEVGSARGDSTVASRPIPGLTPPP